MIKMAILARKQRKNVEEHEEHDQELPRPTITHWSTQAARGGEGCEIEPGEFRLTSDGPLDGVSRAKALCSSISFSTGMCLLMRMPGADKGKSEWSLWATQPIEQGSSPLLALVGK